VEGKGKPSVEPTQPTIDWEVDDNPYKKRYGDSQGQIQPLVRTLNQFAEYDHNTKTWKPKTQAASTPAPSDTELEKLLSGYDPDFVKALGGYISPIKSELAALKKERQESAFMVEYNDTLRKARTQALTEFGDEFNFSNNGAFNKESPLYKLADEILIAKYAQFNPDGSFHRYSSPEAEYMATVEAYAILSKRAKQAPPTDKNKLGAIQGKGTKAAGVKKSMSFEEYNKLSTEEKDAYDLQQTG